MKRLFSLLPLAGLLALIAAPLFGQGNLNVTGVTKAGNDLTITLRNTATVPPTGTSASFRMQGSPTMALGTWAPAGTGPFVAGAPGFVSTSFTLPAGTTYFYRFLGIKATAGDADGDGLPDALEDSLYDPSAKSQFDSDGDGYSDGEEYAYGTDPLSAASKPVFLSKPTVNFVLADSKATEGTPAQVQILFDRTYNGTLNYRINPVNTMGVTDPTAAAATGSLSMNSNSAFIPVPIPDDADASGQRAIILDLKLDGENYFIGGRASHVVLIEENDAWWTGTLIPASGEVSSRTFRVKIAHEGATTTAVFGAGTGNDGLPVPVVASSTAGPAIALTSISTSIIPVGTWPGTGAVDTAPELGSEAGTFHVESPLLLIPPGSNLAQPLTRQLVLHADSALNSATRAHALVPGIRYVGDYTETLSGFTESLTGAPVALAGAVATQSSEYYGLHPAANAVDGNLSTFSYTSDSDTTPSWTLTLPAASRIADIFLERGSSNSTLRDISVQVFSDAAATVSVFTSAVLNPGNVLSNPAALTVSTGTVNARVIRISRAGPYLSLAEVTLHKPDTYTAATLPGTFILVRDIPTPLPVLSKLVP